MTHVELIEKILASYEKEWKEETIKDKDVENFRKGVTFAFKLLITILRNGDEWIYED